MTIALPDKTKTWMVELIAALLILLFVYAAFSKLINHQGFVHALQNSPLLQSFSKTLSWLVPGIEILVSVLLLSPSLKKTGLLWSALLLSGFTGYIAYMLLFIPNLPCSCGGILNNMTWKQHLVFNSCCTLLAFLGWRISKSTKNVIAINRTSRTPV